uniref:centromere protein Q n=1 Tax=Pristiophorus japonicus TaxID=55135 RepID=UPI00398EDBD9
MKPRKKPSETMSARAAEKENVAAGHGETEPPAKKRRKTACATSQINPKQRKVTVSIAKASRWKPLPHSTRDYLTATINSAMYKSWPQKGFEKESSQDHLSQLRQRLLDRCSSIQVPVSRLKDLKNVKKSCALQTEHLREDEATLQILQDELDQTLDTLERNREEVERLEDDISSLRELLDDAEGGELQNMNPGVLNLPELPQTSFQQATLQEKLMAIRNRDDLLLDLQTTQRSPEVRNLLTFLELAHAEADGLSPIGH